MKPIKQSKSNTREEHQEILRGIPTSELSQVVGDFESEGAVVETEKDGDGTWTVTATFKNRKSF